jgi:hypothetical protein
VEEVQLVETPPNDQQNHRDGHDSEQGAFKILVQTGRKLLIGRWDGLF